MKCTRQTPVRLPISFASTPTDGRDTASGFDERKITSDRKRVGAGAIMNIKIKKFQFQFLILLVTVWHFLGLPVDTDGSRQGGQIGTDGRSGFGKATRR